MVGWFYELKSVSSHLSWVPNAFSVFIQRSAFYLSPVEDKASEILEKKAEIMERRRNGINSCINCQKVGFAKKNIEGYTKLTVSKNKASEIN